MVPYIVYTNNTNTSYPYYANVYWDGYNDWYGIMSKVLISGYYENYGVCDNNNLSSAYEWAGFSGKIDTNGYIYDLTAIFKLRTYTNS